MTYPETLQIYYNTHDRMMDAVRAYEKDEPTDRKMVSAAWTYGVYKFARAAAVREGLLPETPQFDVEGEG